MLKRSGSVDMISGPLLKNIVKFTFPIIVMNILQLGFNAADLIVVGRFGSSHSVGAVGSTTPLISLIIGMFIGLSVGVGVSAAQGLGAHDREKTVKTVQTAFPTAFICGLILTVAGVLLSRVFLKLMNTPDDILELSALYLRIVFLGSVPNMIYVFGAALLRAGGDTKRPLYFLIASGILNVILNVVLVAVFSLDVAGVAIATVVSQAASAVLVIIALTNREDDLRLVFKEMKIDKKTLWFMIRVGLPAGIQGALYSTANVILQAAVNSLGADAVAGCAAASSIEGFIWIGTFSFNQTAVNFVGQNVGAKKYARINKVFATCCLCVLALGLSVDIPCFIFKEKLLRIYLDDASCIYYGIQKLSAFSLTYFFCGLCDAANGVLQGLGRSFTGMLISLVGICGVRVLWTATVFNIPAYHNVFWLYVSYPVSWILTFTAATAAYLVIKKKLVKNAL
ncbi:MAG: MATE family efflux transporter [Clostridia bacterium]|nr:MATE family efflux transporter [Clostridia bacterium]